MLFVPACYAGFYAVGWNETHGLIALGFSQLLNHKPSAGDFMVDRVREGQTI